MKSSKLKVLMLLMSIVGMFFVTGCGGNGSEGAASDETLLSGVPTVNITSIEIKPEDIIVPKGITGTYTATAYYSDGTYKDITNLATWKSEDPRVVSIQTDSNNGGFAEALAVGRTTITASYDSLTSNTAKVEVTGITLVSIEIDPVIKTVANGVNVQYRAIGIFSNSRHTDLTQFVTFQSSNTNVATINGTGIDKGSAQTLNVGTTSITAAFDGIISNTATLTVTDATITSIQITPADVSVPKGTTGTYTAIAYFTDDTNEDITNQATWKSADSSIVNIVTSGDYAGDAKALEVGNTIITASYDGVTSNVANVAVTNAILQNIVIDPVTESVAKGINVKYRATGIYSDNSHHNLTLLASFQSSDTSVATIAGTGAISGIVNTLNVGTTSITAAFDGITSNTATLIVTDATITSIQITPADVSVPKGTTGTYTAIAYFTDNTNEDITKQATWKSADPLIVNIITDGTEAGYAEALAVGNTTVTAIFDGITSNVANVEVTAATLQNIVVSPFIESVASGIYVPYTAIGIYSDNSSVDLTLLATWKSSDTSIATIEGRGAISGIAHTLSAGTTNITASFDGVTSNTAALEVTTHTITSIQITPVDTSVPKGTTGTYTAIAYYTDNTSEDITRQATWISGDDTIVSIVPTGVTAGDALAMKVGNTTITASFDGATSNTATVEVTAATLVSVEIVAHDINFPAGTTVYYTALAHYTDLSVVDITETADWSSDEITIATVVMGEVVGVNAGSTNINIEYEGENDSQPITVTEPVITSILITPPTHSMTTGAHKQYLATAYYNNDTTKDVTKDVTWHSSVPEYAVVSNVFPVQGQAFARSVGTTEIFATYDGTPVGNTVTLTVLAVTVTLDSIVVTPADLTVTVESTIGYLAEGHYSNGDVVDITTNVTWASSNTHSATIEATGDLIGVATAVTSGTSTTISATLDGISGNTTLTVDGDCGINKPDSIRIEPAPVNLVKGYQEQIHLIGIWTACEREITFDPAAVWNTDDQDIASMGSKGGLIFGHEVGTTNVNAKYRARTDSAPVNVTD